MKRQKKYQIIASFILIFAIFVFTEINAKSYLDGQNRIIEVCSEGVVYVPPGTKFVKCNGKVKKVIRITPYQPGQREDENCLCPSCCGGVCGVIISCDAEPEKFLDSDSIVQGMLCLLWMDCD